MKHPKIAIIAASLGILGGQAVQAQKLVEGLLREGYEVMFVPIDPRFPSGFRWLRSIRFARTLLNQMLYFLSLNWRQHVSDFRQRL